MKNNMTPPKKALRPTILKPQDYIRWGLTAGLLFIIWKRDWLLGLILTLMTVGIEGLGFLIKKK